jgi:hypothetical protein
MPIRDTFGRGDFDRHQVITAILGDNIDGGGEIKPLASMELISRDGQDFVGNVITYQLSMADKSLSWAALHKALAQC